MTCCGKEGAGCCKYPNGCLILFPTIFACAGLALTAANYSCNLATLGSSATLQSTTCVTSDETGEIECSQNQCETSSIGLFSFECQDTQLCIPYTPDELSKHVVAAWVFSGFRWFFGAIAFWWLVFSSCCCPMTSRHKKTITTFLIFATFFQGMFFMFYQNPICQDYGCTLAAGGYQAIIGGALFLLAAASMCCVNPYEVKDLY